jgi:acyl dehydratase
MFPSATFERVGEQVTQATVQRRGRVVCPTNADYNDPGGIHDDATAQGLGFRGGTIAGSAHLDTFVPLLLDAFGNQWFETGSISIYFRHATTDGEPTVAILDEPVDGSPPWINQTLRARIEMPDGTLVGEGTASVGSTAEPSELGGRDLRHDPSSARILSAMTRGNTYGPVAASIDPLRVAHGCEHRVTEVLDWYRGPSPWGGAIAPPSAVVDLASSVAGDLLGPYLGAAVGMWGALEVTHHTGPVLLGRSYDVTVEIAAVADSPKTEILWTDASVTDDGKIIATIRVLNRFVKASSTLWAS